MFSDRAAFYRRVQVNKGCVALAKKEPVWNGSLARSLGVNNAACWQDILVCVWERVCEDALPVAVCLSITWHVAGCGAA